MPISRPSIKQKLQKMMGSVDNPYRIYTGGTEATTTQLLNEDGSLPYVRPANATDEALLSLSSEYVQKKQRLRVTATFADGSEPDVNAQWWISKDEGLTLEKVQNLGKSEKVLNSYWHIFLQQNS